MDWHALPQPVWRTHPRHWPDVWRRSIQARIVTGTLLMSTIVLILVGWVMMSQVTDGVLESRRTSAQQEAVAQLASLTSSINAADPGLINNKLSQLVQGSNRPGLYEVVLIPTDQADSNAIRYTGQVDSKSIPQELQSSVSTDDSKLYDTYTKIDYQDGRSEPGLAIGSQLRVDMRQPAVRGVLPVPAHGSEGHPGRRPASAAHGRPAARRTARRRRLAGHPPGRHPGPDGAADR